MFSRIEARSFRSLRAVDQPLGRFRVLVGPNGSGKTTFLDVVGFLADMMRDRGEVQQTARMRSLTFQKLVFMESGRAFQLAVEAEIPEPVRLAMEERLQAFTHVRYEIEVGMVSAEVGLDHETLWLIREPAAHAVQQRLSFPAPRELAEDLTLRKGRGRKVAITKKSGGNDNFYTEGKKAYMPSFKLGRTKSALANVPADRESFPVSLWFRDSLERGVQVLALSGQAIRQPSCRASATCSSLMVPTCHGSSTVYERIDGGSSSG